MKTKKTVALFLALLMMLLPLVGCADATSDGKDTTAAEGTTAADTTTSAGKDEPTADSYSAPAAEPEIYDPNGENNKFRVLGTAHSDGEYAVVYGECATGALITGKTDKGDVSVQSFRGCFALRTPMNGDSVNVELEQSYNGEKIGDAITCNESVIEPEWINEPNWSAMIGKDNQAFYQKMLTDLRHDNLLSDAAISSVQKKFARRKTVVNTMGDGCEIICLLVPDVVTVYPEIVPDEYETSEGESRLDQVAALLRDAGITVLDERETLIAHKNDALPLFYKYDSHWTDYGAYLAYVDLFNYIAEKYPAAAPRKFSEFDWNFGKYTGGDMTYYFDVDQGGKVFEPTVVRSMNFEDQLPDDIKNIVRYKDPKSLAYLSYTDEVQNKVTYETGREDLPDLYIFRDSYSTAIFDILAERANRCTFYPMFTYTWNVVEIEEAQPDYVIYLMTEWELENILDN